MIYYFVAFIMLLGIITSYEDIVKGKIRNIWILISLLSASFIYIVIALFEPTDLIPKKYFIQFSINLFISIAIAIILWLGYIWSAGDAKLFIAYAALVPFTVYTHNAFSVFPSFNILINTFVPFFLFYSIKLLPQWKKAFKKNLLSSYFIPLVTRLFVISWISKGIILLFHLPNDYLLNLVLIFVIYNLSIIFLKKKFTSIIIFLSILRLILDFRTVATLQFLFYFSVLIAIFIIIRFPVAEHQGNIFSRQVPLLKLKKGMVLEKGIYYSPKTKKYSKRDLRFLQIHEGSKIKQVIDYVPEGITYRDIKKIRKLFKQGKLPFNKVKVFHTYPFAPFMFLGVIITLIGGGTFIRLIMLFFS